MGSQLQNVREQQGTKMEITEVDREDAPQEDVLDPDLPIVDAHHHLWPSGYRIPTTSLP